MQVINGTKHPVKVNQVSDKNGDLHLLAVVKATYDFPANNDQRLVLSKTQSPLRSTDDNEVETSDEEGELSSPVAFFESNLSGVKAKCDVVVKATAYPPEGYDKDVLPVGFKVAGCEKLAWVQGEQTWHKNSMGKLVLGPKQPLAPTLITYLRTFGGSWVASDEQDESFNAFFSLNPVGTGFAEKQHQSLLAGKVAPNIFPEETNMNAAKAFQPIAFGAIGRHWSPRSQYAGTYDQDWQDNVFPRLPADFDERFFQSAPQDQQIDYPKGGEAVELHNMHPTRPLIRFKLPKKATLPMVALLKDNRAVEALTTNIDTIEIDADAQQLSIVWRAIMPLKRSLREVEVVALGKVCKRWWRSQVFGIGDCGCGGFETDDEDLVVVTEAMKGGA